MPLKPIISNFIGVSKLNSASSIYSYFFILFGFLGGNLCGCFFSILPFSSIFIIIGLVLCLEVYSYIYYKSFPLFIRKNLTKTFPEKQHTNASFANFCAKILKKRIHFDGPFRPLAQGSNTKSPGPGRFWRERLTTKSQGSILLGSDTDPQFKIKKAPCMVKTRQTFNPTQTPYFWWVVSRRKTLGSFGTKVRRTLQFGKIGFLFGIFVDAFKVGS